MRMIGPCDNEFTGIKVMVSRLKASEFTATTIASHLESLSELEATREKALKKAIKRAFACTTSGKGTAKCGTIGECYSSLLESQSILAEAHASLARKFSTHSQALVNAAKRSKKEVKQLRKASNAAIAQYEDARTKMHKTRSKYEASSTELQNFLYSNKPLSPTATLATTEKQAKSYEKSFRAKSDKANLLQVALEKATRETAELKEALFVRLVPSVLNALIELELELGEGIQNALRVLAEDFEGFNSIATAQSSSTKPYLCRMNPSKDLQMHLAKFCFQSSAMLGQSTEVTTGNPTLFGGTKLEALVEKRETDQPNTFEIFPPPFLRSLIQRIEANNGLSAVGIYRLSGNHAQLAEAKEALSKCPIDDYDPWLQQVEQEVHLLTGLLKQFLQSFEVPLLPSGLFPKERQLVDNTSILSALSLLPMENFVTWQALCQHLQRVADNAHLNRMNIEALAVIFAPVVFVLGEGDDVQLYVKIVEQLLQQ